ncbi:MAG: hypothetical protein HQL22_06965 [Candidatus Omnitrophica bacterium]|nr:hypothetical protein [Candidatus Omnitrophota bacterium]
MVKKIVKKKTSVKKRRDSWHLDLAYSLGKAAQKISTRLDTVTCTPKKRPEKKRSRKAGKAVSVFSPLPEDDQTPLSPILKEIKAIADVSGLTAAVEEMNQISLKHSKHPVVDRLIVRIKGLSAAEQEDLSRKFIEKLNSNLYFNNALLQGPSPVKLTEEDCEKMSAAFIDCISSTLEDIGIPENERIIFKKLTGDIARPLNELIQFYVHPKTFGQKVKRLWRMQRIIFRVIKIMRMSQALQGQMPPAFTGMAPQSKNISPNYWASSNADRSG